MAQSAILGFGVSPKIKGLGGGVDRKWVAVGGGKKKYVGQRKGFNKAIRVPIRRGPPALRCVPNQKPLQSWPRVQKHPEEDGEQVEEEGKGQGDAQPNYKTPLANPPPGYFPQQTAGGGYLYPYPYPHPYAPYNQSGYPYPPYPYPNVGYPPHQQLYPNAGYPPQQPYSNAGYPPQQFYPNVGYPPQQPYPNVGYPPQQFYPQQPYPRQQHNPPPLSTIADLASLLANAQEILNGF